MAVRRPPAPRLIAHGDERTTAPADERMTAPADERTATAGESAAPAPDAPGAPSAADAESATTAEPSATTVQSAAAEPSVVEDGADRQSRPRRPRRRTLLLTGSAAAVAVPALALAWLKLDPTGASARSVLGSSRSASSGFSDVDADDPALEAMAWADETGVLPALDDGSFAPDRTLPRADLLTALHRFAGSPEVDVDAAPQVFADLEDSDASRAAALWLHGRAVLWGDTDLRIRTADIATGTETATMIADLVRPVLVSLGAEWQDGIELGDGELTRRGLAEALHAADSAITDAMG